ncbi:hypothetical protein HYW21_09395 [Candidatus Woesearchaeota archaeon]|nr:hypothetical protein [Candidatus Woesearchaeota archaeon]
MVQLSEQQGVEQALHFIQNQELRAELQKRYDEHLITAQQLLQLLVDFFSLVVEDLVWGRLHQARAGNMGTYVAQYYLAPKEARDHFAHVPPSKENPAYDETAKPMTTEDYETALLHALQQRRELPSFSEPLFKGQLMSLTGIALVGRERSSRLLEFLHEVERESAVKGHIPEESNHNT